MQLLAASVGNCLAASLLFALRKFKLAAEPISAEVQATVGRNAQNRLRVQRLSVHLKLGTPAAQLANIDRVRALGYPEEFIRMWEFYFCYCEGGFIERVIGDAQMLFIKPLARPGSGR